MSRVFEILDWILDGLFGRRASRIAGLLLVATFIALSRIDSGRGIVWLASEIGRARIEPFIRPLEHLIHEQSWKHLKS